MATREQLENALRKAHEAGNADHARQLAAAIRGLPAAGQPSGDRAAQVRQEYSGQPWYGKLGTAIDDTARLALNGLTLGGSQGYYRLMGQDDADQRLEDARIRAGSAGLASEFGGAMVPASVASRAVASTVPALASGRLFPTIGREGTAGGILGATEAAGNGGDIASGAGFGAAGGAAGGGAGKLAGDVLAGLAGRFGFGRGSVSDVVVPPKSTSELRGVKERAYQDVADANITYDPNDTMDLAINMRDGVNRMRLDERLHPRVAATLDNMDDALVNNTAPQSILDMDDHRKFIRDNTRGNAAEEARGNRMIENIDDFLSTARTNGGTDPDVADSLVHNARSAHQNYRTSQALDEAALRGGDSANGEGDVNYFRSILRNPRERKLYTPEQIDGMRRIVRGGSLENALDKLSSPGGTIGLTGAGMGLGGSMGGAVGAGVAAGGMMMAREGLQRASRAYTDASIDNLRRIVGGGSVTPAAIRGPLAVAGQTAGRDASMGQLAEDQAWAEELRKRRRNGGVSVQSLTTGEWSN